MKKLTYQFVYDYFKSQNYLLLSKKYINSYTKLKIQCPEGHIFEMIYHNFKSNKQRCTHKDCLNKRKEITCLKKYGVKHYFLNEKIKEKRKQTCLKKYGKESTNQVDEFNKKRKQTLLKNYGVENPSFNPEIHKKQQKYNWKPYTLPSGKIINVQGYENKALDYLLSNIYNENEILIHKEVPIFWYFDNKNIKKRYFPDFYVPKDNLIIEIKSEWTWKRYIEKNLLKMIACLDAGYKFRLMII